MSNIYKWYVLRTATNKEKQCKEQLDSELRNHNLDVFINQVTIPMEKVYHIRNGKKVSTERNHYPGYMLIEMEPRMVPEIKDLIKGINFIIGFLGDPKPAPLRTSEVERILGKMDELASADEDSVEKYIIGETVNVIDGPFSTFAGKITDVNEEKKRLKLNVKIFGRETPLEVKYTQVTKSV